MFEGFLRRGWWHTLSLTTISECIISDETYFSAIVYITFTWCINQFLLFNTFFFLFAQNFLLVNSVFLYFDSSSFCHLPSSVLVSGCSYSFLDAVNTGHRELTKAKGMSWATRVLNNNLRDIFCANTFQCF